MFRYPSGNVQCHPKRSQHSDQCQKKKRIGQRTVTPLEQQHNNRTYSTALYILSVVAMTKCGPRACLVFDGVHWAATVIEYYDRVFCQTRRIQALLSQINKQEPLPVRRFRLGVSLANRTSPKEPFPRIPSRNEHEISNLWNISLFGRTGRFPLPSPFWFGNILNHEPRIGP
jgi:hypothetical protein